MEFAIVDLLGAEACEQWLLAHFHPNGLKCPRCGAGVAQAHRFRQTKKSHLTVYRGNECKQPYNLYSRTVFEKRQVTVQQAVLLIRGVVQGEPSDRLAAELGLHEKTVLEIRHDLQDNARRLQPDTPLPDQATETDEMFQNAGEKRRRTLRPGRPAAPSSQ
jgi:hypothetical protein